MKTELLIALGISMVLFTACGSSSSKGKSITEQLKEREYLVIAQNFPLESCNLSIIKNNINGPVFGDVLEFFNDIDKDTVVSSAENSNVACEKYNRFNDNLTCTIVDYQESQGTSCATGFNFIH